MGRHKLRTLHQQQNLKFSKDDLKLLQIVFINLLLILFSSVTTNYFS